MVPTYTGSIDDLLRKEKNRKENLLILGIPCGDVVVADIITSKLRSEFDIVSPRKLAAPHNEEIAISAIAEDGSTYTNDEIIKELAVREKYIEQEKQRQIEEISRCKYLYWNIDKIVARDIDAIIWIGDGAISDATLIAAARCIKKHHPQRKLIIAIPVAPKSTVEMLEKEFEYAVVVTSPSNTFRTVTQYYQDFTWMIQR